MRKTGDRRLKEDVVDAAIWSRHAEKTGKLAMLLACSRFTGEASTWPVVTIEDADQAIELNNWLTRRLLERAAAHVCENQTESDSLFVLRLIRTKREWTMTDLTKKTRKFTARQRENPAGAGRFWRSDRRRPCHSWPIGEDCSSRRLNSVFPYFCERSGDGEASDRARILCDGARCVSQTGTRCLVL